MGMLTHAQQCASLRYIMEETMGLLSLDFQPVTGSTLTCSLIFVCHGLVGE